MQVLLEQQAAFMRDTAQAQTVAHNAAMDVMTQIITNPQRDFQDASDNRSRPEEKDGLTTERALSLLPTYSGKAEEYGTWRFQPTQLLAEDSYLRTFLEWIETSAGGEENHEAAVRRTRGTRKRGKSPGRPLVFTYL